MMINQIDSKMAKAIETEMIRTCQKHGLQYPETFRVENGIATRGDKIPEEAADYEMRCMMLTLLELTYKETRRASRWVTALGVLTVIGLVLAVLFL